MLPPEILEVFEKVRNAAYFMPDWQLEKVLEEELGHEWQGKFIQFDKRPIAAASIGQVHKAVVKDSSLGDKEITVAVKIQYPGVADSIQSDINNLKLLLKFGDFLPKGLFLENTLRVMKKELEWETDFIREAHWTTWFKKELDLDAKSSREISHFGLFAFDIPQVYPHLSTRKILTTDFKAGVPMSEATRYSQSVRDRLGTSILYLCLKELFHLQAMQTDPNWTNFLFDSKRQSIVLLDFGATREFQPDFVRLYRQLVIAASEQDRALCEQLSVSLGFLNGDETQVMRDIHVDSMITIGILLKSSYILFYLLQFSIFRSAVSIFWIV